LQSGIRHARGNGLDGREDEGARKRRVNASQHAEPLQQAAWLSRRRVALSEPIARGEPSDLPPEIKILT
jgi:hypothetical protein